MENAKKTFIAGLNSDDSFFAHTGNDNLDALNIRVVSSAEGKSGSLSNVEGTREIPNTARFRNVKVIGSYEDDTTNDIFYFIHDEDYDYSWIYCYKPSLDSTYLILQDSNLDPDYTLNFDSNKPITGVSYIDGILYWAGVDGREPWRINVDRGIKANNEGYVTTEAPYVTPIAKSVVTLIRKPPMLPLTIEVQEDSERDGSFLKSRAHTFAYRYVYKDGETSVFSPTSHHYPNQDMDDSNHKTSRKIKVDFPEFEAESYGVSQDVHKVQFAVKFDSDTSYYIWKEFDSVTHATEFAAQKFNVSGAITADFYNDVLGFAVDDASSIKLYDTVPYEAEALAIARNRLFLGNIKEGRLNEKQITSSDISLNLIRSNFNSTSFNQYDRNRGGKVGFSHASAYQIGIAFYDFAGRTGGVLTDDSLKIITPERSLTLSQYNSTIQFTLNSSLINKIPAWAEYYSIVRTKNLTKDFTISNLSDKIRYFKTDSLGGFTVNEENVYPDNTDNQKKNIVGTPNGTFSPNELVSFNPEFEGLAIGLGDLTSYKQGYTYQEGDRIKLITSNRVFEASITGQEGRYVKTNLTNFNSSEYLNTPSLSNKDYETIYEIYSPHKIQPNEFYYECFNGRIIRDGSSTTFSHLSGNLIGDVYLRQQSADTSGVENYFFEGSDTTDSDHENPVAGKIKYIDFPVFYGEGVNDMSVNHGVNNGTQTSDDYRFDIKISSTGATDKFQWRVRGRSQIGQNTSYSSEVDITGSAQTLAHGVQVTFTSTVGHTLGDRWVVRAKKADGANLDEEHDRVYGLFPSPPNGTILQGSELVFYFKEYKDDNAPFSNNYEEKKWEYTMPATDVDKTYADLEELFWETNLGTTLSNLAQHGSTGFSFRKGTIKEGGNGGKEQLHILDHETEPNNQSLSASGTYVTTMIYEGKYKERTTGRDPKAKYSLAIDFSDNFGYAAESMNPSNDYFLNWTQITGRPNLVPREVSSQIKNTGIVFSETKIPGGKINGLSKFSALDEKRLDDSTGPLRSLSITSKTQSTGTVLLAISENETSSIYLGEQQLQQTSSGGQFLAVSSGVIGTINTLQGSYGTKHPESIAINEGKAYWFDLKNQTVVKYDSNGLTPIGNTKMKTYFRKKSEVIYNDTVRRFVIGTYDDYNSEYILSLPQTGESTVTLQQDPYYPSAPVIVVENEPTVPVTKTVNVTIKKPWVVQESVTFIDGVGELEFTSPYAFTIPSNVVVSPSGTNMTVVNSTFSSSNGAFQPGTGKLTISNFFDGDSIVIQLSRVTLPRTQSIEVRNILEYSGDTNLVFASQSSGNTPIRIDGATSSLTYESKNITPSNGTLTIPITSLIAWQFGNTDQHLRGETNHDPFNTGWPPTYFGVTATSPSGESNVSYLYINTGNFTRIEIGSGEGAQTLGCEAGSNNITISNIGEDVSVITLETRPLKKPIILTNNSSNLSETGMRLNGNLTSNRSTTTQRGFVYSTSNTNPEIGGTGVNQVVVSGTGDGDFNTTLSGLTASTTIYAKAYATSNFGTNYGACITTTTAGSSTTAPSVTTNAFISSTSTFSGTITSNGGSTAGTNGITERGFVYSTSVQSPTIGGGPNVTQVANPQVAISSFPYTFTRQNMLLLQGTTYYYRAYAINDAGTSYGSVVTFTTASASVGIGGFSLSSSSVGSNGGTVYMDVLKSQTTGTASGTINVSMASGNTLLGADTSISVAFTNTQTVDNIGIDVPPNFSGENRTITFSVYGFSGISNETGSSTPVAVQGSVTQGAGNTP